MDEITDERLVDVLTTACEDAARHEPSGIHYVSSSLKELSSRERNDPIEALVVGLDFHFRSYPEQRDERGPFGPMMEFGDHVYPMPLTEIPDEVLEIWERAISASPLSTVGARYADLLWERRFGDAPHLSARAAIDLYLRGLDERFDHPHVLMEMSRRAYELARSLNDPDLATKTLAKMTQLVQWSLDEGESPGVALPLLEVLVSQRDQIEEITELVDGAIEVYGGNPWHLESALDLKSELVASADERASLHEAQVLAFRDLAHRSEGIARYAHLQRAMEMASLRGLTDLANELHKEIEGIGEDELGLKQIAAEVSIPTDEIDRFISQIVGDDDLQSALIRFGLNLPLRDRQKTLDFVDEQFQEHPLQAIIPRMTLGPENTMIRKADNEEEQREAAATDYETRILGFHGHLCVEILAAIANRYGAIDSWLDAPMIEPVVVEKVVEGIALFQQEKYDAAASVLAPRLERMVRSIAAQLGLPVTRTSRHDQRLTEVKSLGALLAALKVALPEETTRYLQLLLVEQTSMNLRNRISHGLIDEAAHTEAALLIHAASHLSLLTPGEA